MPRTVLVPAAVIGVFGVVILALLPRAFLELVARPGMTEAFPVFGMGSLLWFAIWAVRGLVRQNERVRFTLAVASLTMAGFVGTWVLYFFVLALGTWNAQGVGKMAAYFLKTGGPLLVVGVSLTRRTAKAWFASSPQHAQMART